MTIFYKFVSILIGIVYGIYKGKYLCNSPVSLFGDLLTDVEETHHLDEVGDQPRGQMRIHF